MTSINIEDSINEQELPVSTIETKKYTLSPKELEYITEKGSNEKRRITPRNTTFGDNLASGSTTFLDLISKEGEEYKPKLEKTVYRLGLSTVLENSVCRPCVDKTQYVLFDNVFSEVLSVLSNN